MMRSSSEAVAQMNKRSNSDRKDRSAQTFMLPWPPSVNGMWRAVAGRNILSQRYRLWREAAAKSLREQRPRAVIGPVEIAIELSPPDARAYDIDNRVKPLFDLLVAGKVIASDDHLTVRAFSVSAAEGFGRALVPGARVTIVPEDKG